MIRAFLTFAIIAASMTLRHNLYVARSDGLTILNHLNEPMSEAKPFGES